MDKLLNVLFSFCILILFGNVIGLIGWALSFLDYDKHPILYRAGIKLMALSTIPLFYERLCSRRCKLNCDGKCGNWTCPNFHTGRVEH